MTSSFVEGNLKPQFPFSSIDQWCHVYLELIMQILIIQFSTLKKSNCELLEIANCVSNGNVITFCHDRNKEMYTVLEHFKGSNFHFFQLFNLSYLFKE